MKRTTFTLFLALVLGFFASSSAQVSGIEGIELIKGKLIDYDDNGEYDYLDFKVKTKFDKVCIPVISVSIVLQGDYIISDRQVCNSKLKTTMNKYHVDIRDLGVSGEFVLLVKFDTSGISGMDDDGNIIDVGPGGIPNETILIIKYP